MNVFGKILGLFLALLFLTSCAPKYAEVMQNYTSSSATCNHYSDISYTPLQIPAKNSLDISSTSPMYDFDSGKSYFASFQLLSFERNYAIEITSYLMGDHIDRSYIFLPTILFLDKEFNVTRIIDENIFKVYKPSHSEIMSETWGIPKALKGKINLTKKNDIDKYMLIYTKTKTIKNKLEEETTNVVPVIIPGTVMLIPFGKRNVNIPYSPTGSIRVTTRYSG